jgi:hypothetical protein
VSLCTNGTQKHVNLRTLFTDGVAIWTQRCRRIRACLDITFIFIYIIYIDVKTCFYAFTAPRWRWLSTERKHLVPWQRHRGRGGYLNVSEFLCAWSHCKDVRVFGESVLRLVNLYSGSIGHLWQRALSCISCGLELCRLTFVVCRAIENSI